jgi:Glycosyl transferases group 1
MGSTTEIRAWPHATGRFKTGHGPRICMPTARNFTKRVFQCGFYEAQDLLREMADVDLIELKPGSGFRFRESWQRRLLYRDISKTLIYANPGLRKVRLSGEYDLFVAHCQTYWDLLYINAIDGWKDRCKTSVCWIDELWASAIPLYKYWIHALSRFDHIFVGYSGTVGPLSAAIGQHCHWLPGAVDALRFSPYPNPPARVIDVYSIGRRWEGIHRAVLGASRRSEIFYIHDTFPSVFTEVYDHQQHRDLYAGLAKRSRYFMVAPGKMDAPEETQGQVTIGFRYYEAAAAGAVMIGQTPKCEEFSDMFGWPDVVIEIQPDGSDVLDVLASLRSESERVSTISRRNSKEALLRHDWVYRWKKIFQVAGIEPPPGVLKRERRLSELAELAFSTT